MNPRKAHQELLKAADIYSEEGRVAALPFEASRVRLLQGSVTPQGSLRFVPDHVREVLENPNEFFERHTGELEGEEHIEPYWDPALDPKARRSGATESGC